MTAELTQELKVESAKAIPPAAVYATHLAGITISDVIAFATLFYILLQSAFLIAKWVAWRSDRKKNLVAAEKLDLEGTP